MDTFKCLTHSKNATAYCRTHTMVLCTNCLINNVHKYAECQLSDIEDALDGDKIHLHLLKLEERIKEMGDQKKIEQNALIKLNTKLGNQIENCFAEIVEGITEKKLKTLDYLKRSIDRRKACHEHHVDELGRCQSIVTKTKEKLNTRTMSTQDEGNTLPKIRTDLRKLEKEIEKIPTEMLKTDDCQFIQFSNKRISSGDSKVLGDIEFADEIYANPDDLLQTKGQLPTTASTGLTHYFPDPKTKKTIQTTSCDESVTDASDIYTKSPQAPPCSHEFADEIYTNPDDLLQTKGQLPTTASTGLTHYFPGPKTKKTIQTTSCDGSVTDASDIYTKSPQAPPCFKIECEDNKQSSCVFKKLDTLTDNRLLVLDSRHQKIFLVDLDARILNGFTEDGANVRILSFCILKKDKVAILAVDGNSGVFISLVSIIKDTMRSKSKTILDLGALKVRDEYFIGIDFNAGTFQTVFAVTQPDRVIRFTKESIVGSSIIAPEHVSDQHTVEMMYDFREDAVFILNKASECLTSYNFKTNKVNWTVRSSKEPVKFDFHPLAMYRSRFLQVVCVDKILRVCKSTGNILQTNDNNFDKNLIAFCVCGNDIIASKGTKKGSTDVIGLIRYKDVLVADNKESNRRGAFSTNM